MPSRRAQRTARLHDDAHDAEEDVRRLIDDGRDLLAPLAHGRDRERGEHGDQQHLEQVASRERIEERVRDGCVG